LQLPLLSGTVQSGHALAQLQHALSACTQEIYVFDVMEGSEVIGS
jgi:hypothetical protein